MRKPPSAFTLFQKLAPLSHLMRRTTTPHSSLLTFSTTDYLSLISLTIHFSPPVNLLLYFLAASS